MPRKRKTPRSRLHTPAPETATAVITPACWLERNRAAIEQYNARVERCGVFSDRWRVF